MGRGRGQGSGVVPQHVGLALALTPTKIRAANSPAEQVPRAWAVVDDQHTGAALTVRLPGAAQMLTGGSGLMPQPRPWAQVWGEPQCICISPVPVPCMLCLPCCTGLLGSQVGQSSPSSKLSSGDSQSLQMAKQGLKACSQDHTSCLWLRGLLSQNTAH